ncbi:MAG: DUF2236 domain-containing protein [Gammaproteobacteria bacterium]|nr:DUF2236 domain-containing protein [Gammaproteobacteria bacterium]
MNMIKLGALSSVLMTLAGCSTMGGAPDFVPSDPEAMTEWQVEGSVKLKNDDGRKEAFITYKQINGEYELEVRQDRPIGEPVAVVKGKEGEGAAAEQITAKNPQAEKLAKSLQASLPLNNMAYWLRALPATENAKVTKKEDELAASAISDDGWKIKYDNYMQIDRYLLPDQIEMEKGDTEVEIELVRADTAFITSPCPVNYTPGDLSAESVNTPAGNPVDALVPRDGSAPLPRWINDEEFCKQLYKVHGRIPDPRVGLYGPDSMFWKLSAPLAPGGMGAGRALLLQTAHPWVTAGIDEHSIVRYDPMERFRRTFSNISTMVYGSMPQVLNAANKVRASHKEIKGKIPYRAGAFHKDSAYGANEVNAMVWVHATLWETLVYMYEELEEPLTQAEKDRFYEETKLFAMLFGIPESALPRNWNEFMAYNEAMWYSSQLTVTDNARKLKEDLFTPRSIWLVFPLWIQEVVTASNIPAPIREGYQMDYGLWERFNNAWLMGSAEFTSWILPDYLGVNPVDHEAHARLEGKRNDYFHRKQIEAVMGTDRLVN